MSLTNTGENTMLDLLRSSGNLYLALFTADPGEAGSLTNEVSGGSYARKQLTFGAASGGSMTNSAGLDFPTATAAWGTVTHFGIANALTGGSLLWTGTITNPKSITSGDIYRLAVGGLTLTLD